MPTETTATLLIGPLDTTWGASVFNPDHLLLLREGFRATWTVAPATPDAHVARSFIRPESPDHLLASGVLGFAAVVIPDLVDGAAHLRGAVERAPDGVSIGRVDLELARRVFACSSELVDGLVTVLPGSSIGDDELALASSHGAAGRPRRWPRLDDRRCAMSVDGLPGAAAWTVATWPGRRSAGSFSTSPYRYPGTRPEGSYAVGRRLVWGLDAVDGAWVDRDTGERVDLEGRSLVLAYGSNADPAKLSEKLRGTVLVLRCRVEDHAAVWCAARRSGDRSVVATLVAARSTTCWLSPRAARGDG